MKQWAAVALVLLAVAGSGCRDAKVERNSDTAVLGGNAPHDASAPAWTDAQGQPIPVPPAPAQARPQRARTGDDAAVAAWITDDHVVASRWTRAAGWTRPEPLERIYGQSSQVGVAGNGRGQAMAVWHHRVGNIHSLRFCRLEGEAWSVPDVVPGALPRPAVGNGSSGENAPRLQMDAQGNVLAQWPSGFHANEQQVARYTPGEGWSAATSEPLASARSASPPSPASSSAR